MKRLLLTLMFLLPALAFGQKHVYFGTPTTIDSFNLTMWVRQFKMPQVPLVNPYFDSAGSVYLNTSTGTIYFHDGGGWQPIAGGGGGGSTDSSIFATVYRDDTGKTRLQNAKQNFTDTTTYDATKANLNTGLASKQNYSDTSTFDATKAWVSGLGYTTTSGVADSVSGRQKYSDTSTFDATRSWVIGQIPSVTGYVPYTGATGNVDLGEHQIKAGQVALDLTPTGATVVGGMYWDVTNVCPSMPLNADVTMQLGQEVYVRGRNNTGTTIANGSVVYINSAQGNNPTIALADADDVNTAQVIGMATEDIGINATGFITVTGVVNGVNTSGYNAGDALYLDTINGGLTKQILSSPHNVVFIGYALNSTNNGRVFIRPSSPIAADTTMNANGNQVAPTQSAVKKFVLSQGFGASTTVAAGTGISVAGVAPAYTVTNTAPDRTVVLTGEGTVSVSGTYPTYTITGTGTDTAALSRRIDLLNTRQGANVASADTINLLTTTGNYVNVTGTTTIRGLSPAASGNSLLTGARRVINFNGALTLTHNATTLILPGNVNRTTVAGDIAEFVYEGGVAWRCISYVPRTVTGTGSTVLAASPSITGTLTTSAITASGTISMTGGTVTLGSSTGASTVGLGTGNTTTGNTKTINIGGAAASGSTQNINIGSTAVSGASQTITIGTAGVGTTVLTGTVTATTQSPGDNSTRLATTAFVAAAISGSTGIQSVTSTNNSVLVSGTSTVNVMVDTAKATQWIVDQTIDSVNIGTGNGLSTNVRFGRTAFTAPTTATGIVAIGESACRLVTTGINNIAIGRNAMANTSVSVNGLVAVGTNNLNFSTGDNNTAIGFQCMARAVSWSGIANAGVGANTGSALTTGSSNSWIGAGAANALTSGSSNTFVGVNSGNAVSTGGQNVILGSFTGNSGGLDIRTVSNRLVLSDGGGNIRAVHNATNWLFGTVTDASTGLVQISGNLGLNTAGNKLNIATGLNASVGTGTLSGGTATINTTAVTASSIIQVQLTSCSSCGTLYIGTVTAGTSFVVTSTNGADASTFNYWIIN